MLKHLHSSVKRLILFSDQRDRTINKEHFKQHFDQEKNNKKFNLAGILSVTTTTGKAGASISQCIEVQRLSSTYIRHPQPSPSYLQQVYITVCIISSAF